MSTVQSGTGIGSGEKVSLEVRLEDTHWIDRRCRSDAVTVPDMSMSSGNWKGLVLPYSAFDTDCWLTERHSVCKTS